MSFLQPWMLIALPLAALPIIIHLINQRRYQTTQWAAMRFLLAANRMTRGYARVRQWLILAMRSLAIFGLILAIGRPLASGSLGGGLLSAVAGGGAAQTIVILDRSPSMHSRGVDGMTRLQLGVTRCAETLSTVGTRRLVLIDSANMTPQEITSPKDLLDLPQTGPSDASADLPAMLLLAEEFVQRNPVGQTEIWILSDKRLHDWRPDDSRWNTVGESFHSIADRVRFQLLEMTEPATGNRSVRVADVRYNLHSKTPSVVLTVDVTSAGERSTTSRSSTAMEKIPVTIELGDASTTVDVDFDGASGRLVDHPLELPSGTNVGWGHVSIPADSLEADNQFFFTFQPPPPRRTLIVSNNEEVARILKIAAESCSEESVTNTAQVVTAAEFRMLDTSDVSLVMWQESTGSDDLEQLQAIVARGGGLIFFPNAESPLDEVWPELSLGALNELPMESSPSNWRGDADLLAVTLAGAALPMGQVRVRRMATIEGDAIPLATMNDGSALLVRAATLAESTRGGSVYAMATTPATKDSSLATDGVVLVVMIQRAIESGANSLIGSGGVTAGEIDDDTDWIFLAGGEGRLSTERSTTAGVVATGDKLLAINRDLGEDSEAMIDDAVLQSMFEGLSMRQVNLDGRESGSLVEEIWRGFLIAVLIALLSEAALCLPRRMLANDARLTIADPRGRMAA